MKIESRRISSSQHLYGRFWLKSPRGSCDIILSWAFFVSVHYYSGFFEEKKVINIKGIDYYRIDEAAEKMGVSISFLYKQRRDGTIGSIQVDRVIWINSEQIEEFFNRYKVVAKTTYSIVEKE